MKSVIRMGQDKTAATYHRKGHEIAKIILEVNEKDPLFRLSFEFSEMTEKEFNHVYKELRRIWSTLNVEVK
jgi:hypothetical protein